jgi:hypothetical protein
MPQRTACDCAGPYAIEVTSIQIDGFELLKFAPATNSQVPTAALRRPSAGVRAGPDGPAHAVSVPTRCRAPAGALLKDAALTRQDRRLAAVIDTGSACTVLPGG